MAAIYYCTTCCVGYETNDPADTVDYVNLRFTNTTSQDKTLTISINGKAYSGHGDPTVGITAAAADGTYVIVTANYWTKRKCTVSGRAQHCTTWLFVTGGNFTL